MVALSHEFDPFLQIIAGTRTNMWFVCRVQKQYEEERLERLVQEDAVKFLWKQVSKVLYHNNINSYNIRLSPDLCGKMKFLDKNVSINCNSWTYPCLAFLHDSQGCLISFTLLLCCPSSFSQCSSGGSLSRNSWLALLKVSPQLRSLLVDCVKWPHLWHPAPQTQLAQMCPSQILVSSQQVSSRQHRRTVFLAVGQRTLWRRCEHWALLIAALLVVAMM